MANSTATGASTQPDTKAAVDGAVRQAVEGLKHAPKLVYVFASAKHALNDVLSIAQAAAPGAVIQACQTAGEFTERGLTRGGVAVLAVGSDLLHIDTGFAGDIAKDPGAAATRLCGSFGAAASAAAVKGLNASTSVLLVDGLTGEGEQLLKDVMGLTRARQQVVGGAAGDDGAFKSPWVGVGMLAAPGAASITHVFDKKPWGVGVDHGLRAKTKAMTVTKAKRNVLYELDGRPAFDVYKEYAATKGITLEPKTAGSFLIGNELGVFFLQNLHQARAPVGVGDKGELKLVAEVAEGARVCILDGEADPMVEASGRAAAEAKQNLEGATAAGVLVFDCVCRGMILGDNFQREIDSIQAQFPNTPVAGFLTYGEIARFRGRMNGWHNTTAVVTAIPA